MISNYVCVINFKLLLPIDDTHIVYNFGMCKLI